MGATIPRPDPVPTCRWFGGCHRSADGDYDGSPRCLYHAPYTRPEWHPYAPAESAPAVVESRDRCDLDGCTLGRAHTDRHAGPPCPKCGGTSRWLVVDQRWLCAVERCDHQGAIPVPVEPASVEAPGLGATFNAVVANAVIGQDLINEVDGVEMKPPALDAPGGQPVAVSPEPTFLEGSAPPESIAVGVLAEARRLLRATGQIQSFDAQVELWALALDRAYQTGRADALLARLEAQS